MHESEAANISNYVIGNTAQENDNHKKLFLLRAIAFFLAFRII